LEKYGRARQATDVNIIQKMHFAYWITEATHTHSENLILTAFLLQQWLHEHALMLHYVYTACHV
jgi:hypothetical protein